MTAQTADNLRLAVAEHRAQLERNAERSILVGSFERVVDLTTALVLAHQTEAEKAKAALVALEGNEQ